MDHIRITTKFRTHYLQSMYFRHNSKTFDAKQLVLNTKIYEFSPISQKLESISEK